MTKRKTPPSAGAAGPASKKTALQKAAPLNGKSHLPTQSSTLTSSEPAQSQAKTPSRAHGKDAKLVEAVAAVEDAERSNAAASTSQQPFDPKSVGKKPVFRPILMSPYKADWPAVSQNAASALFYTLIDLLSMPQVKQACLQRVGSVPRASARKTREKNERRRTRLLLNVLTEHGIRPPRELQAALNGTSEAKQDSGVLASGSSESSAPCSHAILHGLNSITRLLEGAIQSQFQAMPHRSERAEERHIPHHIPDIIFVCQEDVQPPALTAHLPMLVATYNAAKSLVSGEASRSTFLVRVPAESELILADALGVRRCSAVSIDFDTLKDAVASQQDHGKVIEAIGGLKQKIYQSGVQPMRMSWLESALRTAQASAGKGRDIQQSTDAAAEPVFLEPRVKHLRTSMPSDMAAVKADRKGRRAKRKILKKERALALSAANKDSALAWASVKRRKAPSQKRRP